MNNYTCKCKCKKSINPREDCAWNPCLYRCKCDKDCEIGEYLKDYAYINNLADDLVVTCIEIVDINRF